MQAINGISTTFLLGSLSPETLLSIIDYLSGIDQIMVSLTCKGLAAIVETSSTRKIANIVPYQLTKADPAEVLYKDFVRARNRYYACILHKPDQTEVKAPDEHLYRAKWQTLGFDPLTWTTTWNATNEQHTSLRADVGKWLGDGYRFCNDCHKYRVVDKKFWLAFAHYENPGIVERAKEKVLETIDDWNGAKKKKMADDPVEAAIGVIFEALKICPAHVLLREVGGKRLIEPKPEEVKEGDKKGAKGKKAAKTKK
jgi:hypothetical protein